MDMLQGTIAEKAIAQYPEMLYMAPAEESSRAGFIVKIIGKVTVL